MSRVEVDGFVKVRQLSQSERDLSAKSVWIGPTVAAASDVVKLPGIKIEPESGHSYGVYTSVAEGSGVADGVRYSVFVFRLADDRQQSDDLHAYDKLTKSQIETIVRGESDLLLISVYCFRI